MRNPRDQLRLNDAAHDFYAAMSGQATPEGWKNNLPAKRERKPRDCPSEHAEQAAVIKWWKQAHKGLGVLSEFLLFCVPNGGPRDPISAGKLKAEGVRPGIPDLMLAVPRNGECGLFVEMKALDGRVSDTQHDVHGELAEHYRVEVCWGALQAVNAIKAYLA